MQGTNGIKFATCVLWLWNMGTEKSQARKPSAQENTSRNTRDIYKVTAAGTRSCRDSDCVKLHLPFSIPLYVVLNHRHKFTVIFLAFHCRRVDIVPALCLGGTYRVQVLAQKRLLWLRLFMALFIPGKCRDRSHKGHGRLLPHPRHFTITSLSYCSTLYSLRSWQFPYMHRK